VPRGSESAEDNVGDSRDLFVRNLLNHLLHEPDLTQARCLGAAAIGLLYLQKLYEMALQGNLL